MDSVLHCYHVTLGNVAKYEVEYMVADFMANYRHSRQNRSFFLTTILLDTEYCGSQTYLPPSY